MWRIGFVVLVGIAGCDWVFDLDPARGGPDAPEVPDAAPAGLVAWYPMDEIVAGLTADATGNGHDATCAMACPSLAAGRLGVDGGLYFNGTPQHLRVTATSALNTLQGFTVAAWIRAEPPTGQYACLFAKQHGVGTDNSWELCTDNGVPFIGVGDGRMTLQPFGDTWHHVAITWDESNRTAISYVDGEVVTSTPVTVAFDQNPITFGADVDNGSPFAFYKGMLDELRIYERALDPDEITALFQAQ